VTDGQTGAMQKSRNLNQVKIERFLKFCSYFF